MRRETLAADCAGRVVMRPLGLPTMVGVWQECQADADTCATDPALDCWCPTREHWCTSHGHRHLIVAYGCDKPAARDFDPLSVEASNMRGTRRAARACVLDYLPHEFGGRSWSEAGKEPNQRNQDDRLRQQHQFVEQSFHWDLALAIR